MTGTRGRVGAGLVALLLVASAIGSVGTVIGQQGDSPTAAFTVDPDDPEIGQAVTVDAADSSGNITDYRWTITGEGVASTELLHSDFEEGSLNASGWTHDDINETAEGTVGVTTSNSGTHSASNAWGEAALVSPSMDASGGEELTISYWVREGAEPYGENPNPGEGLLVQYLAENGSWVTVENISTDGGGGNVLGSPQTVTDEAAFHEEFQLRFYQVAADYEDTWHIDDVTVVARPEGTDEVTDTGETATHTFEEAGEYTVELTVTDEANETNTSTETVDIAGRSHEPYTVQEAIARLNFDGDSSIVETDEIQLAIHYLVENETVPGTDGEAISQNQLDHFLDLWADDEPAVTVNGGED